MGALRFIHLSDIHFHYATSNGPYDLDDVIRHELVLNAVEGATELGGVEGVLVSGDIAFCGAHQEYNTAYQWLDKLCQATSCSINRVWTVPGNHDVDLTRIEGNRNAERLRATLRQTPTDQLNNEIRKTLEDVNDRQLLFEPLEQYNIFSTNLGCCSTANPLYWEHSVPLNDGSMLRVRGMNSTLVSDRNDSDKEEGRKLILSSFQTKFMRDDGVVDLTMCHHPLEWLRDRYDVEDWLDAHARVQLFGHRHVQRVRPVADNLRVAAGAMHPVRAEVGWEPRYNFITFEVKYDERGRWLHVEVHPRVWNDTIKRFMPDNIGIHARDLPLRDWHPSSSPSGATPPELTGHENLAGVVAAIRPDLLELENNQPLTEVSILNAGEKLTSRYMSLPHSLQREIARKLELIEAEDKEASDTELYRRYFRRAKERKMLERLWNEVETVYADRGEEYTAENPFAGR
jgi:3',5'-cyclic AMP phosphodiesterase CpdA